ncbi:MAG: hypothetical protein V1909_06270 [Candidatus Micrarchaeota archaeon]
MVDQAHLETNKHKMQVHFPWDKPVVKADQKTSEPKYKPIKQIPIHEG